MGRVMLFSRQAVRASLILVTLSAVGFVTAFAARVTFLPHVVDVASADKQQSLWAAFLLREVESICVLTVLVVLTAAAAHLIGPWIESLRRSFAKSVGV
jgi:hypothetical protein